jgi:hypothetical protein
MLAKPHVCTKERDSHEESDRNDRYNDGMELTG